MQRPELIRLDQRPQFYSRLLLKELKSHNKLKEMIKDINVYSDELLNYFNEFNDLKLEELREEELNTYSFGKSKQNKSMKAFLQNIKRERKQVLSWIYYKKWNVLVDDFYYFIADKMNYETEDSDDESE